MRESCHALSAIATIVSRCSHTSREAPALLWDAAHLASQAVQTQSPVLEVPAPLVARNHEPQGCTDEKEEECKSGTDSHVRGRLGRENRRHLPEAPEGACRYLERQEKYVVSRAEAGVSGHVVPCLPCPHKFSSTTAVPELDAIDHDDTLTFQNTDSEGAE